MLGIVFTVISSFWFGVSTVSMRRGVATASALNGLYLTLLPGVPLFWLAALLSGQVFDLDVLGNRELLLLAGAGMLHFLIGRYATLRAMAAIGATRASPIIVGSVLVSVTLAVLLLEEEITPLMGIGTLLVIVGPGIAAGSSKRRTPVAVPSETSTVSLPASISFDDLPKKRLASGYAWAMLNAIAFGTSPLLIREAIGGTGLGVLGGAIAYSTAGLLLLVPLAMPGQVTSVRGIGRGPQTWFLLAAVTIMAAQMFRFLGLAYAPVSIAVPLLRGGSVFIYVMSYFVNRHIESFDRRVLIGIAVSVAGAIALVI